MKQYVYSFKQGKADGASSMSGLLGGKGANLAEMGNLNIPVPPGFTLSTEVCTYFITHGKYPKSLKTQVLAALKDLENQMGQKFGSISNPLLVSVRSGAKISMPGMMETVLNVGLNNNSVQGLLKQTKNKRFVYDSYRRLIMMYADVVMEKSNNLNHNIRLKLEKIIGRLKKSKGIEDDAFLDGDDYEKISFKFIKKVHEVFPVEFPQDPFEQLWGAITAVFMSWEGERAKQYRKIENIPDELGTAVNVQVMVFGNMGKDSATGVAFTRNPSTGENVFFGEWLPNAQGEDVVAGIRTPLPINSKTNKKNLKNMMSNIYGQLDKIQKTLEAHYLNMQDIEFTIQNNKLWILQTRSGKRNGRAAIKIALDFVKNKSIKEKEGLRRIHPDNINELLHPMLSPKEEKTQNPIARGLPAGPGCAVGQIVFDPDRAKELFEKGYDVILIREETSPEDIHGMHAANAILTSRGGMTSHAALVARGWGKCCIVGCKDLVVDYKKKQCLVNKTTYKELDWFTLNGSSGLIYDKQLTLEKPDLKKNKSFVSLMRLCEKYKNLGVRANADSAEDAAQAKQLGAQGIGLCRTEHMFFNPKRIHEVRKMILASSHKDRSHAIKKLLQYQAKDFYGILKAMSPYPVTIRLLDPPLHEFLPEEHSIIKKIAKDLKMKTSVLVNKIDDMKEANPMLGHRGCRLGITLPEITKMQVYAILDSAHKLNRAGIACFPEIMVPLVGSIEEFVDQKKIVDAVALQLQQKHRVKINYLVGAMIELPRACIIADKIAAYADFISFGTNDLTQTTYGFSRDDISSFLSQYLKKNILKNDPFETLDVSGVGKLISIAIKKARAINPKIKIGVCGEHGGDPDSIAFFNKESFHYVSCSPFRVPIASLSLAKL